jgi:glucokinase
MAVLAFDVGGHNVRGAVVASDGKILFEERVPTPAGRQPIAVLDEVKKVSGVLLKRAEVAGTKVAWAGLGFPGFLHHPEGIILKSPNLPGWERFPIRSELAKRFSIPFQMENDANCAALGESWLGGAVGFRNSVLLTLGTGVGGGVIIDGKLLKGAHGGAGELGHIVIEPDGPPCGCGGNGCLEILISGDSLKRQTGRSGKELEDFAKAGDRSSLEAWEKMGRYLGIALSSYCQIFDTEIVVLGGRISRALSYFGPALGRELEKRLQFHPTRNVKVAQALLGDNAGLLGAARLALEESAPLED